jgi:hypothetical protein
MQRSWCSMIRRSSPASRSYVLASLRALHLDPDSGPTAPAPIEPPPRKLPVDEDACHKQGAALRHRPHVGPRLYAALFLSGPLVMEQAATPGGEQSQAQSVEAEPD